MERDLSKPYDSIGGHLLKRKVDADQDYDDDVEIPAILRPKPVVVTFCFLVNSIMGPFMGVYAWNNPDSRTSECYAWEDSKAAIANPIGITDAKNVSLQFKVLFILGFALAMVGILYFTLAMSYYRTKRLNVLRVANTCLLLALLGNLGWTAAATVLRYKHHGKVCSGDYFDE